MRWQRYVVLTAYELRNRAALFKNILFNKAWDTHTVAYAVAYAVPYAVAYAFAYAVVYALAY